MVLKNQVNVKKNQVEKVKNELESKSHISIHDTSVYLYHPTYDDINKDISIDKNNEYDNSSNYVESGAFGLNKKMGYLVV